MIISKFYYLRKNLYSMAELVLEQVILLSEAMEADNYDLANEIVKRDDLIDDLEKENDNLSQNAILEAVTNRNILGMGDVDSDIVLKKDPLRFALSAIRITRNMERMGDQVVRDDPTVLAVPLHPQVQGLQAPQHQEAVHRAWGGPAAVLDEGKPFGQGIIVHHQRTHHHIAVAAEVLGDAVHHQVRTHVKRVLQV
ncbi:MAG: PhoU domain-containing protein, partial [Leptospira sp.]|nr:PhoU domain-containing protein [Leptospira sp.]